MTKILKTIILFTILAFDHAAANSAEETEVSVRIEPQEILIGQPADMQIRVRVPAEGKLIWPGREELEAHKIEILNFGMVDTLERSSEDVTMLQVHRITAWEEAYVPIPPLEFQYITANDTILFQSQAQLFEVKSVEVDMQEMYRDVKPLFSFPVTFREMLPYILVSLGVLLALFFLIRFIRKRKKPTEEPTIWEKPEVPAHIAAISGLETLRRKELWQKGQIKTYHSELTTILRKYLYKRFNLDALEMTTREIVGNLPVHVDDVAFRSDFIMIFELADRVKFAKFTPEDEAHIESLEKAIGFVKNTAEIENYKE